jgi:hypothetical protein
MACGTDEPMGFDFHDEWGDMSAVCFKRKFRWLFVIPDISANGTGSLPPSKAARPNFSFKEMEAPHLNETIFFPSKPEWKPVNLTLFDIKKETENPIFSWLKRAYNPANCSRWYPALDTPSLKVGQAELSLFDGCGQVIETWVFEHAWPQTVEFGDLDMSQSEVLTCDVTLRYDRAYIVYPTSAATISFSPTISNCAISSSPIVCSNIPLMEVPELEFGKFFFTED